MDALLYERVLTPLGLHDTTFPTAQTRMHGPHATGYLRMAAGTPYQPIPARLAVRGAGRPGR